MTVAYYLSPALVQLRAEVNTMWPGRDKASDGWIGDAAHSERVSDHNPDADGSVNAIDVDRDGIDVDVLLSAVLADARTSYVIWSGRIWQRTTGRWATYTGANGHYHHVHVSIRHGATWEQDRSSWRLIARTSNTATPGTVPTAPSLPAPTPIQEDDMPTPQDLWAAPIDDPNDKLPPAPAAALLTGARQDAGDARAFAEAALAEVRTVSEKVWAHIITGVGPSGEQWSDRADAWLRDARRSPEVLAHLGALRAAVAAVASGTGLDPAAIEAAAKAGAEDALRGLTLTAATKG